MGTVAADSRSDLFVHDDIYLYSSLRSPLQDLIEPPFLVEVGRPPQEEFWTQPPVLDVDGLLGLLQGNGDGVEIVLSINIPLNLVAISLRGEGLKAVTLRYLGSLVVGGLFMLLVVTMVGIDEVRKLANLVLEMDGAYFGIVKMCIWTGTCYQPRGRSRCGVMDEPFN